jgi:CTP synthase
LHDAYKSILEALIHAGVSNFVEVNIKWVDTEKLEKEKNVNKSFENIDGILIPGGFGNRGIEGKILASKYARDNFVPFLGICLGLQCAVIDFARHRCNIKNANSTEFQPNTKNPVIDIMPKQKKIINKGATMRLGSFPCRVIKGTNAMKAYKKIKIYERHRHRYEVNNKYLHRLTKAGLVISGKNLDLNLVEMIEIEDHPWFVGVQFHPELKSRIINTHPLFKNFISESIIYNGK